MEGDVAEAQRGHDGERPVDPGYPAELPAFQQHDGMEKHAEDKDEHQECSGEPRDVRHVAPRLPSFEEAVEFVGGKVHSRSMPRPACQGKAFMPAARQQGAGSRSRSAFSVPAVDNNVVIT